MKSILMFIPSLEKLGGAERVFIERYRIFKEAGFAVAIITARKCCKLDSEMQKMSFVLPGSVDEIENFWRDCIRITQADILISDGRMISHMHENLSTLKKLGVKLVLSVHFPFNSALLLRGQSQDWLNYVSAMKYCDSMAVVSAADRAFWEPVLSKPVYHVQNPFVTYGRANSEIKKDQSVLWVGRLSEEKRPDRALEVFERVLKKIPTATLRMIGGDQRSIRLLKSKAAKLGIVDSVDFIEATKNLAPYFNKASVYMLTSITESFALVIAEAKSYYLPIVMAEIPFLDLVADGKGVIQVPQGDLDAMADSVVNLLQDSHACTSMGVEGNKTLSGFNDKCVLESWVKVFEGLLLPELPIIIGTKEQQVIRELHAAWKYHCEKDGWKIEFCNQLECLFGSKLNLLYRMQNAIITFLKKAKQQVRLLKI